MKLARIGIVLVLFWLTGCAPNTLIEASFNADPNRSMANAESSQQDTSIQTKPPQVTPAVKALPKYFIANQGQINPQVHYYTQDKGRSVFFTESGVHFSLRQPPAQANNAGQSKSDRAHPDHRFEPDKTEVTAHTAQLQFIGSNPQPEILGEEPLPGRINYQVGTDRSQWRHNIPTFNAVLYRNLYPGIDVRFYRRDDTLEYDVIVSPGADPTQVQFSYVGAESLQLNAADDLLIQLGSGVLTQRKPLVYQAIEGHRRLIKAEFVLTSEAASNQTRVGFQLAAYDPKSPLVIDPVLDFATYLGESDYESGRGIAIDGAGRAWVTGATSSADFPVTDGSALSAYRDAFVARLNVAGGLDYATYLGGSDYESAYGIAIDGAGRVWVTGQTHSADFPVTDGSAYSGNGDAFVARLNVVGGLDYATYLGGSSSEDGLDMSIAVDGAGRAWVTGATSSADFPVTDGSALSAYRDAFVARLNVAGGLDYATYLGGSDYDSGYGIAIDGAGRVWVTGQTQSADFPVSDGSALSGSTDAFVARLDTAGSLEYAAYLGGSNGESGNGIAVDGAGRAWVTGNTQSADFPVTDGSAYSGNGDAFVARLDVAGGLDYATYLGGSNGESGYAIAIDGVGRAWVTGATSSADFPVSDDSAFSGINDAFVARLDAAGGLDYASYLGGSVGEISTGIAVDGAGRAWVTGQTSSDDFPVSDDSAFSGEYDAFVARLGPPPLPSTEPFVASDPAVVGFGQRPAVAFNTVDREFMVAYLVPAFLDPVNYFELRLQRMDITGQAIGPAFDPFGIFGTLLWAKGRPDIAYSPQSNSYLIAVPRLADVATGDDMVVALEVKGDGTAGVHQNLFIEADSKIFGLEDASPVRVAYNTAANEFVVSTVREINQPSYVRQVIAQRLSPNITLLGTSRVLTATGGKTHSLAYAPVSGGRYALVHDGTSDLINVYDAQLNYLRALSLDLGEPFGNERYPDLAFGRIGGKDRMMMTWWDADNCRLDQLTPCPEPWNKRLGVWGVFFELSETGPWNALGHPFPILTPSDYEQVVDNVLTPDGFMPRVAYNVQEQNFYVGWREFPLTTGNQSTEIRTHIRGAWVDYPVEDGGSALNAPLYDNVVVSLLTDSTCPTTPPRPNTCPSLEDPRYPDVAAVDGYGAVVVWQQKVPSDPNGNTQITGRVLAPPSPINDTQADATSLEFTFFKHFVSLLGADVNGIASCGQSDESPDVWYRYTAPEPGVLHINTCGSHDKFGVDTGMDTVLSLHRLNGSQFDDACNDDAPDGNDDLACDSIDQSSTRDSALQLVMHQGQTILARVSRYGSSYGTQSLLNADFEGLIDSDQDGYANIADNCTEKSNVDQRDSDGDGFGNICDADFDNSGRVNFSDLGYLKSKFGTSDPKADIDGDGKVNFKDLGLLKSMFGQAPGPSGVAP